MELDSFLASPRWEILKIISERPSSPIQIARKTSTTVSFISQQLKLLEAAQIVNKKKTGEFEKGKPRNVFSISRDFFHIIVLENGFAEKKTFNLEAYQKALIKTWSIDELSTRNFLEEILFNLRDNLQNILGIGVHKIKQKKIFFIVEDKKTISLIQNIHKSSSARLDIDFLSFDDFKKISPKEILFVYGSEIVLDYMKKLDFFKEVN